MVRLIIDNGRPPAADPARRSLLATIHVARKTLGMVEDDYRAMLERVTGQTSAGDCDIRQLRAVLDEFGQLGFRHPAPAVRRSPATGPVARKARALWISLGQLGAIDDPTDETLDAFGKRQLGVDRLQWASERDAFRLIEALKAIATRHGWDQSVSSRLPGAERIRILKDRLVGAQLARLAEAGVAVTGPLAGDRAGWSDNRLQRAAAELAVRIRDLKTGCGPPGPTATPTPPSPPEKTR